MTSSDTRSRREFQDRLWHLAGVVLIIALCRSRQGFQKGLDKMVFGKVFDFVKDGVQEMLIHRPDEHKDLIIYKHPEQTIPKYSQLTVDADEAAVFFRDGAIIGTMRTAGAGQRHMLDSQNIPFLGQLIDKVTGGNIFITDLYFVTMRPIYEQRFGGTLGYMEDPLLGEMVTPRIFGTFSFQIVDPARFIVNYVGLRKPPGNEGVTTWIRSSSTSRSRPWSARSASPSRRACSSSCRCKSSSERRWSRTLPTSPASA